MDSETRHPVRIGRFAGVTELATFAISFLSVGGPSDVLHL
jgi:hypothetical protein